MGEGEAASTHHLVNLRARKENGSCFSEIPLSSKSPNDNELALLCPLQRFPSSGLSFLGDLEGAG
jgi:hypothetical protein